MAQRSFVRHELQERSRPITGAPRPEDVDSDEEDEGVLAGELTGLTSSSASASLVIVEGLKGTGEEVVTQLNTKMDEDIYGFAATSLIRDSRKIVMGEGHLQLRLSRLIMAQLFVALNIFLQATLLLNTKTYVTAKHVHDIREVYDQFEFHMYGSDEAHTYLTVNGKHRGLAPEYFRPELFATLDKDIKRQACRISISHPKFIIVIILFWTLTCFGDMKANLDMMYALLVMTPTITTMENSMAWKEHRTIHLVGCDERMAAIHERCDRLHHNERLVIGLTYWVKAYIAVFIGVPRLLIVLSLLWLGSRWLLATIGFENILLNAVALEFVLLLKDLLYRTVMPLRNKMDVSCTQILPTTFKAEADFTSFLGSFVWFLVALVWTWYYCHHLQKVLPGFRWDVRNVCTEYMRRIEQFDS